MSFDTTISLNFESASERETGTKVIWGEFSNRPIKTLNDINFHTVPVVRDVIGQLDITSDRHEQGVIQGHAPVLILNRSSPPDFHLLSVTSFCTPL
ncbi:MAG: hypothetical protein ACYCVB_18490, partial [Bacilli bacterium]